ncbi:MAG TPA: MBL fold metallo-hydrolase [Thermoplasmata archaeon]|nr:MBL fold metallo-hydrolase [Thermoplasmata archaeon]
MQVAPGVTRLTHGVSNFYLVEAEGGLTLVDAGVAGDWSQLVHTLASLGKRPSDLKAILLTHAHSDHTGFAERARREWGMSIWTHSRDAEVGRGGRAPANEGKLGSYLRYAEAWRTLFGLLLHGGMRVVPIQVLSQFEDGAPLDVPGHPQVIHLPGHTAGMSALVFESPSVVFTGDALVTRNPLTGRRGPQVMPRGLNQSSRQAIDSLARLEGITARLVLPGHGEPWAAGIDAAVQAARSAGPS